MRMPRSAAVAVAVGATAALCSTLAAAQSGGLTSFTPADKALKWGPCPDGLPKGCQVAVLNGDPAKPNADIYLKLPAKSKIQPHKHTSAERIVMMQGTLNVTYEGGKPTNVTRGTYFYGPAGVVHEGSCVSAEPCILFIAFEQPVDFVAAPMAAAPGKPAAASAAVSGEKKPKKGGC